MRALITGASGFVGRHLWRTLADEGYEVHGVGHQPASDMPAGFQALDLLDSAAVRALDLAQFDLIFHLAGLAAVGPSFDEPRRYIDTNAGMQINLLEACLGQGALPKVLIVSTGGVYGPAQPPITEETALNPTNPYAVSKITQEELGRYYSQRGFKIIIARPLNHVGPGQDEGFLVSDLAKQVALESSPIAAGDLSTKRDYTDVRDIARAYLLLMRSGREGEVYNVCGGKSISGIAMLDLLQEVAGTSLPLKQDPGRLRPSDISDIYGSHAKLIRDTGWQPKVPLEQTLQDVLNDWRQRLAN